MKIFRLLAGILLFFIVIYAFKGYIRPAEYNIANNSSTTVSPTTTGSFVFDKIKDIENGVQSLFSRSGSSSNNFSSSSSSGLSKSSTSSNSQSSSNNNFSANRDNLPPVRGGNYEKGDNLSVDGIFVYINSERSKQSVPLLRRSVYLDKSATLKLNDMFSSQYFEHVSPTGASVSDVVNGVGYKFLVAGENLALGNFGGDPQVVAAWMASEGHRVNILDRRYTETGIAVGYGMYKGQMQWIAVQHFARPMSSCPAPRVGLKDVITSDKNNLAKKEEYINFMKSVVDKTSSSDSNFSAIVSNYNDLVNDYNNTLKNLRAEIANYNEQVNNFNGCLDSVTKNI